MYAIFDGFIVDITISAKGKREFQIILPADCIL